jgi:hypothetical protein
LYRCSTRRRPWGFSLYAPVSFIEPRGTSSCVNNDTTAWTRCKQAPIVRSPLVTELSSSGRIGLFFGRSSSMGRVLGFGMRRSSRERGAGVNRRDSRQCGRGGLCSGRGSWLEGDTCRKMLGERSRDREGMDGSRGWQCRARGDGAWRGKAEHE